MNGNVVSASVDIQETLKTEEGMLLAFRLSWPGVLKSKVKSVVEKEESIKCGVVIAL